MKKQYTIDLEGCDDGTSFTMELTESEAELLKKVAEKSQIVSTYSCMPKMYVDEPVKSISWGDKFITSIKSEPFTATFTLTEDQMEEWKNVVMGDRESYDALELAKKTISEIFPEYAKAYEQYTPKKPKPKIYTDKPEKTYWLCPVCGQLVGASTVFDNHTFHHYTNEYCGCGQHILWEDEE